MNPFAPATPPSASKLRPAEKGAPLFVLPASTPKTPQKAEPLAAFRTPATQKRLGAALALPHAPPTPRFTPQKSPRRRPDQLAPADPIKGLIPTHSTVGSGRHKLKAPISFSEYGPDASPTRLRRKRMDILRTPGAQLITDDLVEKWHGKLRAPSDSESDGESHESHESRESRVPVNPFLGAPTKRHEIQSLVDYSTHAEYVSKTGERTVVELTEEQRRIKPKRLFPQVT